MVADAPPAGSFSLRRWSQRKLAAARAVPGSTPESPPEPSSAVARDGAAAALASGPAPGLATAAAPGAAAVAPAVPPKAELPPIESLSLESDFTPFLQPEVDDALRRQALKKLFRQPAFNVMDGLDVYIDDYGKPDPIAPEVVRQLVQGRYLFDPPSTRVNAQGAVEDVPPQAVDGASGAKPPAAAAPDTAAVPDASTPLPASAPTDTAVPATPSTADPTP